jgi:peptidyl-prolyl cis-trans isomerase C
MIYRSPFLLRTNFIVIAMGLAFILNFGAGCSDHSSKVRYEAVVRVNQTNLTAGAFSDLLARRLRGLNVLVARDANVLSQIKNTIIQDFIVNTITVDWAKKNKIFVQKEFLDSEVKKIRSSYEDEISFRKTLDASGLTYDIWLEQTRMTLLSQLVAAELRKSIPEPTNDDLLTYYVANKAKYFVAPAVKIRQVVLQHQHEAELVNKKVKEGRTIAELAKKYSITPEGNNGGLVGWIEKGAIPVFDMAFKLAAGQKSSVLKSPFGYHIYEVIEKRNAKNLSFDEAKSRIKNELLEKNEQENYSVWLEKELLSGHVYKNEALISSINVYSRED